MFPNLDAILKKMSNPFIKLNKQEELDLKSIELSVKKDVKEFSREAKELYQDQRYQKLKNEFKRIYEQNLRLIIYFDCDDTQRFIMKIKEYQVQLRTLKSIFDTPEGFIKKEEEIETKDKNKI